MEIDFSVLDSLKSDALKCPTSEDNSSAQPSTPKEKENQPQGEYEGESGSCFHKLNQLKQTNEKIAELYRQEQEKIKKAGKLIPEITKGIMAADNPLTLLLKAIECIGTMTGNKAFYDQSLQDIKTVYGIGLHDPRAIEIEMQEIDSRLSKLWEAINTATPEEQKSIERAIQAHEQRIEYLKELGGITQQEN